MFAAAVVHCCVHAARYSCVGWAGVAGLDNVPLPLMPPHRCPAPQDAFTSQAVTPSYTSHGTGALPDASTTEDGEGDEATSALRAATSAGGSATELQALSMLPAGSEQVQLSLVVDEAAERPVTAQLAVWVAQLPPSPFDSPSTSQRGLAVDAASHLPATPHASAASMQPDEAAVSGAAGAPGAADAAAAATAAGTAAAGGPPSGAGSSATSPGEAAVREALLVQQFLDGHSSQLTYHGLLALLEGLRPNQLAVFFRWGWQWGRWQR